METSNNINAVESKQDPQTIIISQEKPKNGLGTAGFVLSITGLILCWVPILKWLLLIPSFLLSLIGLTRKPRTLAIIGVLVSGLIIALIVIIKAAFLSALIS